MTMITEEMVIAAGKLFKPHSYKGEMNLEAYFGVDLFRTSKTPFFLNIDNILVPFFVENISGRTSKTSFIKLKGINSDREAAKYANKEIYALKSDVASQLGIGIEELEQSAEGVIGYQVVDSDEEELIGTVEDTEEGKEYDYLIVRRPGSDDMLQIPFVDDFIDGFEEGSENESGKIYVNLPDGFLDI